MFRRLFFPALIVALACPVLADDKKPAAPDDKAVMEAMMKHATPGPFHKKLEPLVGDWTYQASFMMAPGTPEMKMSGTANRKWLLDGRFMSEHAKNEGGEAFEGMGVTGYDNASKKYTFVWIDSMTTTVGLAEGDVDSSGKVFTYRSNDYNPMFGQKIKGRNVITVKDNDHHQIDFYTTPPSGAEFKSGTIQFTRKK